MSQRSYCSKVNIISGGTNNKRPISKYNANVGRLFLPPPSKLMARSAPRVPCESAATLMLLACVSSSVVRADRPRDESSVAAMVKAIEVKQVEQVAKQAVQMAKQEEQIREQMARRCQALPDANCRSQRLELTDADFTFEALAPIIKARAKMRIGGDAANEPPKSLAAAPPIRILALALKPADALERFRRRLPTGAWVEALQAIDGFNLTGACNAVVARSLRYHKLGKPSAGMLGNWLTKYDALQAQIRDRAPFQVMIEDDLVVSAAFAQLVLKLVRSHFGPEDSRRPIPEQVNLVVLGRWGEAYLTSLASAKRVVRRLRLNGIRRNPDIQLNDGSVGRTIKLPEHMSRGCWNLSRATNQGDIKTTPRLPFATGHKKCGALGVSPFVCRDYLPTLTCRQAAARGWCDWSQSKNTGDFKWRTGWHSLYCQATCNRTLPASFPPHPSRPTSTVCPLGELSTGSVGPWCSKEACNAPKGQGYAKPYGNRSTPYCDSFTCCDVAACKLGWLGLGTLT